MNIKYINEELPYQKHETDVATQSINRQTITERVELHYFECDGFSLDVIREYPPGDYSFPFRFKLQTDFPTTLVIKNHLFKTTFELVPVIITSEKVFEGNPIEFPILYNQDTVKDITVVSSKLLDKMIVTLKQPKTEFYQGENMEIFLSLYPNNTGVTSVTISLIGCYLEGDVCYKPVFNSVSIPINGNMPILEQQLLFPITYLIVPSIVTSSQSLRHYVSVKCQLPSMLRNTTKEVVFPV